MNGGAAAASVTAPATFMASRRERSVFSDIGFYHQSLNPLPSLLQCHRAVDCIREISEAVVSVFDSICLNSYNPQSGWIPTQGLTDGSGSDHLEAVRRGIRIAMIVPRKCVMDARAAQQFQPTRSGL